MTTTQYTSPIRDPRNSMLPRRAAAGAMLILTVLITAGCDENANDATAANDRQEQPAVSSNNTPASASDTQESTNAPSTDQEADADEQHEYTNRLINSTSPYLLQHAHNPVDWYPWGEEALQRAKRENKPIFLSVGYSTCYWCHVMEREVFEHPEIAALMNDLFINIKVDREQRPDLDEVYMTATQLMTRRGGWPNSVFLTPDLKPFFAGTYFGPTDQGGRPGFPRLIQSLADAWDSQRSEVLATADRASDAIQQVLSQRASRVDPASLTTAVPDRAVSQVASRYDARLGGFGGAPKFPQDFYYEFLFDVYERTGEQRTLDMTLHTLRMMAAGGIYDHVGGGFHRYSTDAQWRVPHFEKMLYNQAQLTRAYVGAYETTSDPAYADIVHDILRYVGEVMTGPDGQFYSALDAETDAVEGAYYVWNRSEVQNVLSSEDMQLFDKAFALGNIPTFPGHKHPDGGVLYMRKPITDLVRDLNVPYEDLRADLDELLSTLKARRDGRKLPRLDDKVIAGWNGMMIGAYALAGDALDESAYIESAANAAEFVLDRMRDDDGRLMRIWRKGVVGQPAFHEDYAFLIQGLLALHGATDDVYWLEQATGLARTADEFWDSQGGGYYFAQDTADLLARSKSIDDGAIPSGNSAMLHNLVGLWRATGDEFWKQRVEQMLGAFGGSLSSAPSAQVHMVHALERWLRPDEGEMSTTKPESADIELPDLGETPGAVVPLDGAVHVNLRVRAEPDEVAPGSTFTVHVILDVGAGWHINSNPASDPNLIPTLVDLRPRSRDAPVEALSVDYPDAVELRVAYSEQRIKVYEGSAEVVIAARLGESASPGEKLTIPVFVQFQACDDSRCLPPSEQIIDVSLAVGDRDVSSGSVPGRPDPE